MALRHSRKLVVLSLVVIILLASASLLYLFKKDYIMEVWSILTMPKELSEAMFISDSDNGTILYRVGDFNFNSEDVDGALVSIGRFGIDSLQILRSNDGLYRVSKNTEELVSSKTAKVGIAQSPSGTHIAYAEIDANALDPISTATQIPIISLDTRQWGITVMNTVSKTFIRAGIGVSPLFVDDSHVVWFSPRGIYSTNIQTGEQKLLLEQQNSIGSLAVLQSPDRSLIARHNKIEKNISVYKVTANEAEKIATVPIAGGAASYSLGNEGIYSIAFESGRSEIYFQSFTGGEAVIVHKLPFGLPVTRLLLGSL